MKRHTSIGKKSKNAVNRVREGIFIRDKNRCVIEGTPVGFNIPCVGELTIQHSVKRGMGGSAKYDLPVYLRAMCAHHNSLDASDASFNRLCVVNGWSVPRWVADQDMIASVPVRYGDGWHLLNEFERIRIPDRVAFSLIHAIYGETK